MSLRLGRPKLALLAGKELANTLRPNESRKGRLSLLAFQCRMALKMPHTIQNARCADFLAEENLGRAFQSVKLGRVILDDDALASHS